MKHIALLLVLITLVPTDAFTQTSMKDNGTFSVVEASIPDMQAALKTGRVTSRELVLQSLVRIATYEDKINAVITVNPNALKEADERDRERAAGTTSTPQTCRPRAALWRSRASCRRTRRR